MEDKSLLEVREWKRQVYEEFKDLSFEETQKRLRETTNRIMKKYNLNLKFADSQKKKKNKKAI